MALNPNYIIGLHDFDDDDSDEPSCRVQRLRLAINKGDVREAMLNAGILAHLCGDVTPPAAPAVPAQTIWGAS